MVPCVIMSDSVQSSKWFTSTCIGLMESYQLFAFLWLAAVHFRTYQQNHMTVQILYQYDL